MPNLTPSPESHHELVALPENSRVIPAGLKHKVDALGLVPGSGNLANLVAAGMSSVEVVGQAAKWNKPGMVMAGKALAIDLMGVIPLVGNLAKGSKFAKIAEAAKVLEPNAKGSLLTREALQLVGQEQLARQGAESALGALGASVALKR